MAEYSSNAVQTVAVNQPVVFTESPVPCNRGLIRHRDGAGSFTVKGYVPNTCGCPKAKSALYTVDFSANIAVPSTGTAEAISLAIALDGVVIPASTMTVTPAATEQYFNVSCAVIADVWGGCCGNISVENVSSQPILVQNANIILTRPDLAVSY